MRDVEFALGMAMCLTEGGGSDVRLREMGVGCEMEDEEVWSVVVACGGGVAVVSASQRSRCG